MANKNKELTEEERDQLAVLRAQGKGVRECARQIGRGASTITRELHLDSLPTGEYVAINAQHRSKLRKQNRYGRESLKNPQLYNYVLRNLRNGWSPEQICGRAQKQHPDDSNWRIVPETIYGFIYSDEYKYLQLWEYLPRKHKKRRKQQGRKFHRSRIPDRVSIHKRPKVVDDRKQFGHFEGDTVEGQRSKKDGIHTELERTSRKLYAVKVNRIASAETVEAQIRIFEGLPVDARRTTTLDNDREHHQHTKLREGLNMQTYFADPYSSWQRSSNEYHNGLLRRYLPKRTDFTALSQDELDDIVEEINNRPRKCLDYATPNEVFSEELKKIKA